MCIAQTILETRHDAQMCMCIMSCFNDIFAMHIFASCCVTVVSHTLLFNVRAPSWRAQLSHKRSNTTYFAYAFLLKMINQQCTDTHTRLWWIMRWTQFIWLRCTNVPNNMDAWLHGFQTCVCCIRFFQTVFPFFNMYFQIVFFNIECVQMNKFKKTNWMCFNEIFHC